MRLLTYYLHNGYSGMVEGIESNIDVLKTLLIPNQLVKGIVIYARSAEQGTTTIERVESINYTRLKELREETKK